jgi:hypothetical protein
MKDTQPTYIKFEENFKAAIQYHAAKHYQGNLSMAVKVLVSKGIDYDHKKDYKKLLQDMQ